MKLSSRAYDLRQAFGLPGCPICRLTLDSVHHYLDSLLYEYVNQPDTHDVVREARGFCANHAWHALDQIGASALSIAVLYEGLIRTLLRDMGESVLGLGKRRVTRARSALKPRVTCPACAHQMMVEEHLIRNLVEHLDQVEFADAFSRSAGLCLPHLRQALELPGDTPSLTHLLTLQRDIWGQLQRDLEEFIRKYDYRFADEDMGSEGTSPRRAIEQLTGARGIR